MGIGQLKPCKSGYCYKLTFLSHSTLNIERLPTKIILHLCQLGACFYDINLPILILCYNKSCILTSITIKLKVINFTSRNMFIILVCSEFWSDCLIFFSQELERLPVKEIQSNIYIKHPVSMEQYLMEGSYNKVC